MRGQPMNQAMNNANTGLSKTPAVTIPHCAEIETLPMACRPCHPTLGHIALGSVDQPFTGFVRLPIQTELASPSNRRNCKSDRLVVQWLTRRLRSYLRVQRNLAATHMLPDHA